MRDKELIQSKSEQLKLLTSKYCDEYLNDEYKQLCIKLIKKMERKKVVPFLSGKIEIWAAATVYTIGSINFLFDKSFEPFVKPGDISKYFGAAQSTTTQKSKLIRDMFKLHYYDSEFSTSKSREDNPFNDMVMINGFIVNKNFLSSDNQE
ncbi:MAG: DUF6398 domain-containing protein [Firmicutes bacterium]|nr:DUF6398 domain-containing protein [Bacillota bacterium]